MQSLTFSCQEIYQIRWDINEQDQILHKCTMTYTYLNNTQTLEACVMYDPRKYDNNINLSVILDGGLGPRYL